MGIRLKRSGGLYQEISENMLFKDSLCDVLRVVIARHDVLTTRMLTLVTSRVAMQTGWREIGALARARAFTFYL